MDEMKRYAVAISMTKQEQDQMNVATDVFVVTARSEEEAEGICIREAKNNHPLHQLAVATAAEIKP